MAIEYVGGQVAGRANPSNATAVTFALTGGLASVPAAGDLVIVTAVTGSAAGTPAMAITTPTGYTALGQLNQSAVTADTSMDVSYKVMGGTPDTTVTIPGTTNNAWAEAYAIQVFRGVDSTTPMDVAAVSAGGTATGRPNPASITPTTAGAYVVICGGGAAGTGATYTAPANYTTNFLTANGADTTDAMVGCGYRAWTSGAEDPAAYTGGTTGANDSWCAYTLALRPAVVTSYSYTGAGGAQSGGVAPPVLSVAPKASGGAVASGVAALVLGAVLLATGGGQSGGTAALVSGSVVQASGGGQSGDTAGVAYGHAAQASGGAQSGGVATLVVGWPVQASGGAQTGGSATVVGPGAAPAHWGVWIGANWSNRIGVVWKP